MDKESRAGGGPSPGGIVAILMLTAGVLFIREAPLETTRLPVNEPRIQQGVGQDVDARLWQDPFGAVARAREEAYKLDREEARNADLRHDAQSVQNSIATRMLHSGRTVEIFGVMLPGGPYSDNVETRRRVRYAVLAGLNASRLAPVDGEHLGYFFPAGAGNKTDRSLPEIVPYEWFEPAPDSRFAMSDQASIPLVLVLWLDGDVMYGQPLAKLRSLVAKFEAQTLSWRVLGPGGSDGLREMLGELERQGIDQPLTAAYAKMRLRFYSASATAPDERIFGKSLPADTPTLSDFLARYNVQLVRTIGDDSALADALIAELKLRGLQAGTREDPQACDINKSRSGSKLSHIGVISEWDTLYGRTLRREFRAYPGIEGFCVHRSSYVRGLDGQLPAGGSDGSASKAAASKPGGAVKEEGRRNDGTFIEIAEGQSQFDYLRRLALRMAELDRQIRSNSPDGTGLAAIGVLGSDVHDKLLVLQALQPALPNAIFFTTDLDARFLHPRETAWTRNLIVGSNFGLRLSDRFQAGLPPFRDGYQSAAFLATLLAVDDTRRALRSEVNSTPDDPLDAPTPQKTILGWLAKPRIFEIGRTTAFDFSPAPQPVPPADGLDGAALAAIPVAAAQAAAPVELPRRTRCEGPGWRACGDIHPDRSPAYPELSRATLMLVLTLLILPLWLPPILLSRAVRQRLNRRLFHDATPRVRAMRWAGLALLLAFVHLALPLWFAARWDAFAGWLTRDGKPMVGLEGISIWPTEGLRLVTLLLCVYLIYAGWVALSQNLDDIIARFRLGRTRRELVAEQVELERHLPFWQRLANMFSLRFVQPVGMGSSTGLSADSIDFWRRYIVQNRIGARATRTLACVVLALAVSWFLKEALHDVRFVPQRGQLSLAVHEWLHLLMFLAMYFLVFFVVDATTFCVGFVRGLRVHGANWPPSTLAKFEQDLHIPRSYLDNWIDLEFIALRTRCVTRLIYFPFIVLSLFLVSRSAAFDDWYMPAIGIVLAVLGASVALACAVVLRYSAEASRRFAMERLRDEITRLSGDAPSPRRDGPHHARPNDPPKAAQLTLLLQRMDHLHEGAFAPFWQQPLLKAVLLPFATLGGTSLLDYLALVNV